MYTPKHFEENDPQVLHEFMRGFSFALLVSAQNGTLVGTHLPLHVEAEGACGVLLGHVARANGHWRQFDGVTEAMAVFQGPHSYISPNWYANDGLVPTWNYATIHAYGRPQVIEDSIEITVDGVPNTEWYYDESKNSVSFQQNHIPDEGEEIVITYSLYGCLDEEDTGQ